MAFLYFFGGVIVAYIKDELEEAVGRKWTRRLIGIGIVLFLYCVVSFFAGIWPFSSAAGVVRKVTSPTAIIQNYEWFYDQYHAIEAQRRNIRALPEGSTDHIGTQMVLNNMIAEYNAKSREITRNLWKAEDLPYQIGE
jgi:amino acid transporter